MQYRHASSSRYPVPQARAHATRKKRSDYNFLASNRLMVDQRTAAQRNKLVYRKLYHVDAQVVKQHREAVRTQLETNIHHLPRDVVMAAFFGLKRGNHGAKWRRTLRMTRTFHSLSKDRLVVHAFFEYLKSDEWKQKLASTFSAGEQQTLQRCRSSWLLESSFQACFERFLKKPKHMQRHAENFWRFALIHRNDAAVPMAWDHYQQYLPVTKSMLVERTDAERAAALEAQIPSRRFVHTTRNAALRALYEDYCAKEATKEPLGGRDRGRPVKLGRLRAVTLLPHLKQALKERQVIAKMFLCFFETPEAKLFNSGVSNFVQIQRFRHVAGKGGLRPKRAVVKSWFKQFKNLSANEKRSYYGIPPRYLDRPTNGYLLFLQHCHLEKQRELREAMAAAGLESHVLPKYPRIEVLQFARLKWKLLNDVQRCTFEFPFPVSIAPIRPNRAPFHRFLVEQTRLLAPPLGRTGRTPKWFLTDCQNRWRALAAADKNRYDTDEEVRVMFPLVE